MKKVLPVLIIAVLCLVILVGCDTYYNDFIDSGVDTQGIVKWATISLSAKEKDIEQSLDKIQSEATRYQAKVVSQVLDRDDDGLRQATYTFQVSKENFDKFVNGLTACGKVRGMNVIQESFDEQINVTQNQIDVLNDQRAQYENLLLATTDTSDKILLIEKIADIDRQLLSLKDQIAAMGAKDYYVVRLNLSVVDNSSAWGIVIGLVVFFGFWAGLIILIIKISKSKPANKSSNN